MPIDPMTGQLYTLATNIGPIGLTALQQRPDQYKAMDSVLGGGLTLSAIKYRSHRALLTEGPYKSVAMKKASGRKYFEKSYAASVDDPTSLKNLPRDFLRDKVTQFNPFNWGRAPSMAAFDPETVKQEYQMSSGFLRITRLNNTSLIKKLGIVDDSGTVKHWLDPGSMSRIGAANTWDRRVKQEGNRVLSASENSSIQEYLEHANPDLLSRLTDTGRLGSMTLGDAGILTRMGMSKSVTGPLGGFIQGALHPGSVAADSPVMFDNLGGASAAARGYTTGDAYSQLGNLYRKEGMAGVRSLAGKSAEELAAKGLGTAAAEKFAEKGATTLALRAGLEVGGVAAAQFIPGVDIAVDVYLAYQVAKLGAKVTERAAKAGIRTVAGAYSSFEGNIKHPVFGMGYHDTLAAKTSRSRGVAAIQNSRLNARSVLGNEASAIYQHFAS